MKNLIEKYKKNKSLINCIILLSLLSVLNTFEGYIYGKFGLNPYVFILEFISFIVIILLLSRIIITHEEGKCFTVKK
jgi:hypothetical protein